MQFEGSNDNPFGTIILSNYLFSKNCCIGNNMSLALFKNY